MTDFIPAPIKPEITIDHLDKIDIRVGAIERVELFPASSKLVKLTVDFGDRRRTVLVGLRAERVDPKAEIEGRQALFVVNLPARLWPVRSPRRCCSTSATRMALPRCSRYWKSLCQTALERDDCCFRSGAAKVRRREAYHDASLHQSAGSAGSRRDRRSTPSAGAAVRVKQGCSRFTVT